MLCLDGCVCPLHFIQQPLVNEESRLQPVGANLSDDLGVGTSLQAAKDWPIWVESLEADFMAFLADSGRQRMQLAPMPKAKREIVHEYASEGFGLMSHSMGSEPARYVTLFKTPSAGGLLGAAALSVAHCCSVCTGAHMPVGCLCCCHDRLL